MHKPSYYTVNAITLYRLVAAFLLLFFILTRRPEIFKWLLALSFFTDAIDGYLARKYKVVSVMGSRIDSIADDLTVLMAIVAIFVFQFDFIRQTFGVICLMVGLYILQLIMAFIRYGKQTSFHTLLAKCAAIAQAIFLILFFFLPQWPTELFYVAAALTILDLLEEIGLVILLPKWQTDVKGLYWILNKPH